MKSATVILHFTYLKYLVYKHIIKISYIKRINQVNAAASGCAAAAYSVRLPDSAANILLSLLFNFALFSFVSVLYAA